MRYLPHTDRDINFMLNSIGKNSLDELFESIPEGLRLKNNLNLPNSYSEWDLDDYVVSLSEKRNRVKSYLGGGIYNHRIPNIIPYLTSRSEFLTSYTPYQPEISQGTLQAMFEFQTYISEYLKMDYSNASMYDGATSFAEAVLLSVRDTKKRRVAVSNGINPNYLEVLKTYTEASDIEVTYLELNKDGKTDLSKITNVSDFASVSIQSPNYFGIIEDQEEIKPKIGDSKTLFISVFTEILSFGLYNPPGFYGADIACGEAQSLGIPQSFGGPGLGIFTFNKKLLRSAPGRLIGETVDKNGDRSFCLTLATREQHIRREKATSNICSNQGLCVISATIYFALAGGKGLQDLAISNYKNCEYLKQKLLSNGCTLKYSSTTFNEFMVKFPDDFDVSIFESFSIEPGIKHDQYYLVSVTEAFSKTDLDNYADIVGGKNVL